MTEQKKLHFTYPDALPVSRSRTEIMDAIRSSQVVIVSGQTGSGKTTQIPKMLLDMGRGTHGKRIIVTQPRRIAARSVAERIAEETHTKLGDQVGYRVRFTDESSAHTRLVIATDGILLAQIQRDPLLSAYDTIMIDEAHERSLNIDFLLGYLTTVLVRRRDLKLIITSATIDSQKFQEHFSAVVGADVPVIEVSGRTFPVQVIYEPVGSAPALVRNLSEFRFAGAGADASGADDSGVDAGDSDSAFDDDMAVSTAVARACAQLVVHSSHDRSAAGSSAGSSAGSTAGHSAGHSAGRGASSARDILVFAAGERDIREYETAIRRAFGPRAAADAPRHRSDAIEIVPLYARLSAKDQHKVFEEHTHQRIIIATNVAETSLTVPGIRYVVDPGFARISRYSKTAKVQRLPIEPISQASANQRSGRCGRIADGIAIRLYSSEDFESRDVFTDPEIVRTSLGSVVLQMLSVGVAHTARDVTNFGFIDPPDMRAVSDGFNELFELKAIRRGSGRGRGRSRGQNAQTETSKSDVTLTKIGRQLARLPLDVRLARMIVEASSTTPNTLANVLAVVAFLSLQDPRERPEDQREEADRVHKRFVSADSDFLTALNLWTYFFERSEKLSSSQFRKLCQAEFVNFLRMRQWRDLYQQLSTMCAEMGWQVGAVTPLKRPSAELLALPSAQQAAGALACAWDGESIHRSMLAGLLSSLGMQVIREPHASQFSGLKGAARARAMKRAAKMAKNEYQGARGTHFALFPGSAVASTTPAWVMTSELVETSRLWARTSAAIQPEWAYDLARDLTKTSYGPAHWSGSSGSAVAEATIHLYGLPIITGKKVQWGRINPAEARELLIRQGLIEGDITRHFSYDDFVEKNRQVLEDAGEEVHRTRQVADVVSDEDLYDFYDSALPATVTSVAELAKWWKGVHDANPELLDFDESKVERLAESGSADLSDYPDTWHVRGTDGTTFALHLSYVYDTHAEDDGVTVHIPLSALLRVKPEDFTWNVPGILDDLIIQTIKSLPKALRVQFVPAPDTAARIRKWLDEHYPALPGSREALDVSDIPDFTHAFTQAAISVTNAQLHPEDFGAAQLERLPGFVRLNFAVESDPVRGPRGRIRRAAQKLATGKDLSALQQQFSERAQASAHASISRQAVKARKAGHEVQRADLLHNAGATNQLRRDMLWSSALDALRLPADRIRSRWLGQEALVLATAPYANVEATIEDMQRAAVRRLMPNVDAITTDAELAEAISDMVNVFEDTVYAVAHDVIGILRAYANVQTVVSGKADLPLLSVLQSVRTHSAALVEPGFIGSTPADYLPRIKRYLQADVLRVEKAKTNRDRDVQWAWEADEASAVVARVSARVAAGPGAGPAHEAAVVTAEQVRWMYEEFLVSLWAQEYGTAYPVSMKRLRKAAGAA
ncbi:ATP-dependent RNA helicase HrpA [Alloscardovia macacae]|uniref:ATP-dependent RNA helicase HrpA n=1 Tax=Alloscardovia macacae TaxID=1160091 RepID=A0A1Y2SYV9_9BIFI|nr:ATP-dependent RNA helicase HrpA [Alloscardovia macacae]OTA25916.1 ATP-dependent RNA helicase HrpA [Alloscardovia macacae]OTA28265.1 ATP-dependent RNA helicase HrpA [Alloscardovia macacae]